MNLPACPLCADASASALDAMRTFEALVDGAGVCEACAERVSNAFAMARGGRWLTWPNEPAPQRRKDAISAELRTAVFERDRYRCRACRTHLQLTADHIVAESSGGPTTLDNLQTLCRSCNSRKGTRRGL